MGLITNYVYKALFGRHAHSNSRPDKTGERLMGPDFAGYLKEQKANQAKLKAYPFEQWELTAADGVALKAHYYHNPAEKHKTVIIVHGHGANGFEGGATVGLHFIQQGYSLLLPDNRSCGLSGGTTCTFGILESGDTIQWLTRLNKNQPGEAVVLYGCSLGGATVCLMTGQPLADNVAAAVSDCAYADIAEQIGYMIQLTAYLPAQPLLSLLLKRFRQKTGLNADNFRPAEAVIRSQTPTLFYHGRLDHYVPVDNCMQLYQACAADKKMIIIEEAGHAASQRFGGEKGYYQPMFEFLESRLKGGSAHE